MSNEAAHPCISCFPPLYSRQFLQGWQSPKSEQVHLLLLRDILLWGFNYQWKEMLIRKEKFSFSPRILFMLNFSLCSLISFCLNSCPCACCIPPAALVLCWKFRGGSVACSAQNNSRTKFSSRFLSSPYLQAASNPSGWRYSQRGSLLLAHSLQIFHPFIPSASLWHQNVSNCYLAEVQMTH